MKQRIFTCLMCVSLLFNHSYIVCDAESNSNRSVSYPSNIEEYDELYFLENMYMENVYYENYYAKGLTFQRLDLSDNSFAQELRMDIEEIYSLQQSGTITTTLEHNLDCSYQEYVEIVLNTYIEFIKYYQYQDCNIQPDFSTCSFTPYIKNNNDATNTFCTDISINYIIY